MVRVKSRVPYSSNGDIYGIREDKAVGDETAAAACVEFRCR